MGTAAGGSAVRTERGASRSAGSSGTAPSTHCLCPAPSQAPTHVGLRTARPGIEHSRRGPARQQPPAGLRAVPAERGACAVRRGMDHSCSGAGQFQNLLERSCSLKVKGEMTSLPGACPTPGAAGHSAERFAPPPAAPCPPRTGPSPSSEKQLAALRRGARGRARRGRGAAAHAQAVTFLTCARGGSVTRRGGVRQQQQQQPW